MTCTCGYSFAKAMLRRLKANKKGPPFKSYALIHNDDYRRVMKLDAKVLAAKTESTSSKYVGTAMTCPKCARLTVLMPRTSRKVVYAREK